MTSPVTNPFIGPRPFERGEATRLHGRGRDTVRLLNKINSDRIVIVHADTGAGKSSLVSAAILPLLAGFLVGERLRPSGLGREIELQEADFCRWVARAFLPPGGPETSPGEAADLPDSLESLAAWLDRRAGTSPVMLYVDQLEEVFLLRPRSVSAFFRLLGSLTLSPRVWLLLVVRNDYLADVLEFAESFCGELRSRFSVPLLSIAEAESIVRQTVLEAQVELPEGDVESIVRHAAERSIWPVRALDPATFEGEHVVLPLFLQVFAARHFESGVPASNTGPEGALRSFVDGAIAKAIGEAGGSLDRDQENLREWCETHLVQGSARVQAKLPDAKVAPLGLDRLTAGYLVTQLPNGRVELSHDSFVEALIDSNRAWVRGRRSFLAVRARSWRINAQGREAQASLLGPRALLRAAADLSGAEPSERKFYWSSLWHVVYSYVFPLLIAMAAMLVAFSLIHRREMRARAEEKVASVKTRLYELASRPSRGMRQHAKTLAALLGAQALFESESRLLSGDDFSLAPSLALAQLAAFRTGDFAVGTLRSENAGPDLRAGDGGERTLELAREGGRYRLELFPQDPVAARDAKWPGHQQRELFTLAYLGGRKLQLDGPGEAKARSRAGMFDDNVDRSAGAFVDFSTARPLADSLLAVSAFHDGRVLIWRLPLDRLARCSRQREQTECHILQLRAAVHVGDSVAAAEIDAGGERIELQMKGGNRLRLLLLPKPGPVSIAGDVTAAADEVFEMNGYLVLSSNASLRVGADWAGVENGRGQTAKPLRPGEPDYTVGLLAAGAGGRLYQIRRNGESWLRDLSHPEMAPKPMARLWDSRFSASDGFPLGPARRLFVQNVAEGGRRVRSPGLTVAEAVPDLVARTAPWLELFPEKPGLAARFDDVTAIGPGSTPDRVRLGLADGQGGVALTSCEVESSSPGRRPKSPVVCDEPTVLAGARTGGEISALAAVELPAPGGGPVRPLIAIGYSSGALQIVEERTAGQGPRVVEEIYTTLAGINTLEWIHDAGIFRSALVLGTRDGRVLVQEFPREIGEPELLIPPAIEIYTGAQAITVVRALHHDRLVVGDAAGSFRALGVGARDELIDWGCKTLERLDSLEDDLKSYCREVGARRLENPAVQGAPKPGPQVTASLVAR